MVRTLQSYIAMPSVDVPDRSLNVSFYTLLQHEPSTNTDQPLKVNSIVTVRNVSSPNTFLMHPNVHDRVF